MKKISFKVTPEEIKYLDNERERTDKILAWRALKQDCLNNLQEMLKHNISVAPEGSNVIHYTPTAIMSAIQAVHDIQNYPN